MQAYDSLQEAIADLFGSDVTVQDRQSVSGGDINAAYVLTLSDGGRIFMKRNKKPASFFIAEANGLAAIRATGTIASPAVLAVGEEDGAAFLLMEYVEEGRRVPDFDELFGRELAAMHLSATDGFVSGGRYGFYEDNIVGARSQINTPNDSWAAFFWDCRLKPLFRDTAHYFSKEDQEDIVRLHDRLPEILPDPPRPSLLHGDLWGGNYMTGPDGKAWLIDPAVSVGDAEADIAMTTLFGGFGAGFYRAYHEVIPEREGARRRYEIYNLYHLLNHLYMFGGGYLSGVRRAIAAGL